MYEPIKEETKEQYLKIWSHYAIGHFSQEQLAKLFNCSQDTIANAIKWWAKSRTQFPTLVVSEAAKDAVEHKLRELNNDLVRIKESNPINWNAYIGIQKLIKENEELLWQFQEVIQAKKGITINNTQVTQVQQTNKLTPIIEKLPAEQQEALHLIIEAIEFEGKIEIEKEGNIAIIKLDRTHPLEVLANVERMDD